MGRVLVPTVCLEGFGIIFENQSSHQTKAFKVNCTISFLLVFLRLCDKKMATNSKTVL